MVVRVAACLGEVSAVCAEGRAVDGAGQTAQGGGDDQLRTHVGERHGGCGGAGVAAVVTCAECEAESADCAGNFDGVVHTECGLNQRDDGGSGGQLGCGAVNVGGVLCGGEHDASQALHVLEGLDVLPPVFGGDGVDSHPCDDAGVEHTDDLFAGGVLLFRGAAVFEVDDDGVSLGFEGLFKNFFGGVGAHEEPRA